MKQSQLIIKTSGRGFTNLTDTVAQLVAEAHVNTGVCHLFIQHTSASLLICENADSQVQRDLEAFMQRLSPDGDPLFQHVDEGPDDMPAHVRTLLTETFLIIPISDYRLGLGRWQGIYLWEHRLKAYERKVIVTIQA